jgi:hypothetical protein
MYIIENAKEFNYSLEVLFATKLKSIFANRPRKLCTVWCYEENQKKNANLIFMTKVILPI